MFLTKSRNCFCLQGPWYCRKWQYPIAERKEKPLLDAKKDSKAAGALECSGRDESPCITFDNLKAARICRQLGSVLSATLQSLHFSIRACLFTVLIPNSDRLARYKLRFKVEVLRPCDVPLLRKARISCLISQENLQSTF